MIRKYSSLLLIILTLTLSCLGQQPTYFQYTTEEEAPSNEIYSIIQDEKGFIWLGCDAGLYKYNGIKFIHYKSSQQKSKSLTGLTISTSGKLYCYSFNGQLFFVDNDSLIELNHPFGKLSNIACNKDGQLLINHNNGISIYTESTKSWLTINDFNNDRKKDDTLFTLNVCLDKNNNSWFLSGNAVCKITKNKVSQLPFKFPKGKPSGEFLLTCSQNGPWIFGRKEPKVYKLSNNKIEQFVSDKLNKVLENKKITNIKSINEGNLYICTYSGIIIYNIEKDEPHLLLPYFAISDCILDREGNYWLSTLQNGLIKIPNLDFVVWNSKNKNLEHDNIYRLTSDKQSIYFATADGYIGIKNAMGILQYQAEVRGDVQQLTYDSIDKKTYYTINNSLYFYNETIKGKINNIFPPIKSFNHYNNLYFIATSRGTFVYTSLTEAKPFDTITEEWSRSVQVNTKTGDVWIATNNGLIKTNALTKQFEKKQIFIPEVQIVSCFLESSTEKLFALTFNGKIYSINKKNESEQVCSLSENIQGYQLQLHNNKIYVATNKGIWIYNLGTKNWTNINKTAGLASDNVQNILIENSNIWIATSNGLQQIPINYSFQKPLAKIYLKRLYINNNSANTTIVNIEHNQSISFEVEASTYSSNNKFNYAYRIKNNDTNWTILPSNIEKIEIPKLPSGLNIVEIKLIDHLGRNSEEIITISVDVNPPFWQKWWFNALIGLLIILVSSILFKQRLHFIEKKQQKEIERLKLENELRLSQQSALKAQMNPHFIFNVLNSIKGYIYENDKKNAAMYLSSFSDLVRKVLQQSSVAEIKLEEELEILKLYIELESMLLQGDFLHTITLGENINTADLKIPGLIIQPFIENAFKHGLRHKKGGKKLELDFKLNESKKTLVVSITDNGIGRIASAKLNESNPNNHESFATEATARRIELLNYDKKDIVSIQIIDLLDESTSALGTTVILTIQLNG
jgi:ligand-binding sensor domain-containing protein